MKNSTHNTFSLLFVLFSLSFILLSSGNGVKKPYSLSCSQELEWAISEDATSDNSEGYKHLRKKFSPDFLSVGSGAALLFPAIDCRAHHVITALLDGTDADATLPFVKRHLFLLFHSLKLDTLA